MLSDSASCAEVKSDSKIHQIGREALIRRTNNEQDLIFVLAQLPFRASMVQCARKHW